MAGDHFTAPAVDPVTGVSRRVSAQSGTEDGVPGHSAIAGTRRRRDSSIGHEAAAPVSAPFRHDGPEIARCFGLLITEIRKKLPLRPVDAAYRAWISRSYWEAIERGRRLPSLAVFIMVARALGLDPRELLDVLLERMHYGRGAPPVFQGPPHGRPSEAELEYQRLMAAARDFTKVTEMAGPRLARFHSAR